MKTILTVLLLCVIATSMLADTNVTRVTTLVTKEGYLKEWYLDLNMNPTNLFSASGVMYATNMLTEIVGSATRQVLITNNWMLVEGTEFFDISSQGLRSRSGHEAVYQVEFSCVVHYNQGLNQDTYLYIGTNGYPITASASFEQLDKGIHYQMRTHWILNVQSNMVIQPWIWNRGSGGSNGTDNANVSLGKLRVWR